ncbi:MAG TPA: MFS transporter, partial [Candidatus Dormibacteraeota bacterium]
MNRGASPRGYAVPFFALGAGSFVALYLPQPLLPDLDHQFHTPPSVTGLVMTAGLLGFALAGLLREGDPDRTLRRAMWLVAVGSIVAALSPALAVLLVARAAQGVGTGMLIAGGLAEVPRRLPPTATGLVTAAMISGTALGGLLGRIAGYTGIFLTWRGAFVIGGLLLLVMVGLSLRTLTRLAARSAHPRTSPVSGPAPVSIILAGLFILFVNVAVFDLLPYRLSAAPFGLSIAVGDLVYLVFLVSVPFGWAAGWAIDRFG